MVQRAKEKTVDERVERLPSQRSVFGKGVEMQVPVHQYGRNKPSLAGRVGSKVWLHVMVLSDDRF